MDHAGDIAWELAEGFVRFKQSQNSGGTATEPRGDREKQSFIVHSREGIWFRVTVDYIDYSDLTHEEDYRQRITARNVAV